MNLSNIEKTEETMAQKKNAATLPIGFEHKDYIQGLLNIINKYALDTARAQELSNVHVTRFGLLIEQLYVGYVKQHESELYPQ